MSAGEPAGASARPIHVTETLVAETALGSVPADWDADRAVTALYSTHYRSLVRLAALLVRDVATAGEGRQDSFVAMHGGWRRLGGSEKALSYLRQSVVNRSRSVLRHRVVVDRNAPKPSPDMPSAEHGAIVLLERSAVVSALRTEFHPAAESFEPAADGLNRIRGRLSPPRPLAVAWLMVGWTSVGQPALLRIDELLVAFGEWLRATLRPVSDLLHPVAQRLRPVLQPAWNKARALFTPRTESGGRPSRYAWLRPALAMAAVVAVAGAGGFAPSGLPRPI